MSSRAAAREMLRPRLVALGGRTARAGGAALPGPVAVAVGDVWREIKVARVARAGRKRFRELRGMRGLKVHLGCGADLKPGWVNVDLALRAPLPATPSERPHATFIGYDLRLGLPLDEGSCDYIYSSHFFEHLELRHGVKLMRDCYRALQPGGTFRLALPDFRPIFQAYLDNDRAFFDLIDRLGVVGEPAVGDRTLIDYINYCVYQDGEHRQIYDQEKLISVLTAIGYRSVSPSGYREGIDPDTPVRCRHSFYVEAVK